IQEEKVLHITKDNIEKIKESINIIWPTFKEVTYADMEKHNMEIFLDREGGRCISNLGKSFHLAKLPDTDKDGRPIYFMVPGSTPKDESPKPTEERAAEAFRNFASFCREQIRLIEGYIEDGEYNKVAQFVDPVRVNITKEFQGFPAGFIKIIEDAILSEIVAITFVKSRKKALEIFGNIERNLQEFEKLMHLGMLLDAEKAWVKSGEIDAWRVVSEAVISLIGGTKTQLQIDKIKEIGKLQKIVFHNVIKSNEFNGALASKTLTAGKLCSMIRKEVKNINQNASTVFFKSGVDIVIKVGMDNTIMPSVEDDRKLIKEGDLVTIDFGIALDGLNTDWTIPFVIGTPQDISLLKRQEAIYRVVKRGHDAGIEYIEQRLPKLVYSNEISGIVKEAMIEEAQKPENSSILKGIDWQKYAYFSREGGCWHPLGHGTGFHGHELPILDNARQGDPVIPGTVFTIEPGTYCPEVGGIRVESTVAINYSNRLERLTPKHEDLLLQVIPTSARNPAWTSGIKPLRVNEFNRLMESAIGGVKGNGYLSNMNPELQAKILADLEAVVADFKSALVGEFALRRLFVIIKRLREIGIDLDRQMPRDEKASAVKGIQALAKEIEKRICPTSLESIIKNTKNRYRPGRRKVFDTVLKKIYGATLEQVIGYISETDYGDERMWIPRASKLYDTIRSHGRHARAFVEQQLCIKKHDDSFITNNVGYKKLALLIHHFAILKSLEKMEPEKAHASLGDAKAHGELLGEWPLPQVENKEDALGISESFVSELKRKLKGVQPSNLNIVCDDLAVNTMTHGRGGVIKAYHTDDSRGLTKVEVISIDNGPGMDNPNELLKKSIKVHQQDVSAIYGRITKRKAPQKGFGLRNIVLYPPGVIMETKGKKYVKVGTTDSDLALKLVGPSDVKKGVKTTLTWPEERTATTEPDKARGEIIKAKKFILPFILALLLPALVAFKGQINPLFIGAYGLVLIFLLFKAFPQTQIALVGLRQLLPTNPLMFARDEKPSGEEEIAIIDEIEIPLSSEDSTEVGLIILDHIEGCPKGHRRLFECKPETPKQLLVAQPFGFVEAFPWRDKLAIAITEKGLKENPPVCERFQIELHDQTLHSMTHKIKLPEEIEINGKKYKEVTLLTTDEHTNNSLQKALKDANVNRVRQLISFSGVNILNLRMEIKDGYSVEKLADELTKDKHGSVNLEKRMEIMPALISSEEASRIRVEYEEDIEAKKIVESLNGGLGTLNLLIETCEWSRAQELVDRIEMPKWANTKQEKWGGQIEKIEEDYRRYRQDFALKYANVEIARGEPRVSREIIVKYFGRNTRHPEASRLLVRAEKAIEANEKAKEDKSVQERVDEINRI
ncbi:M24 family metallopeptidase, partial [bacterium]|nr:M24 family metallopeptidase [bacterium]